MKNENLNPIGVFDSGLGGLNVLKEIVLTLPEEDFIYFGDTINCPYGNNSVEEINKLTFKAIEFLIKKNCKLIVLACHTATTASIIPLRNKYPFINFIGIEPALKPAILNTKTGKIVILATKATIEGERLKLLKERFVKNEDQIISIIGEGLVEIVENCQEDSIECEIILRKLFEPFKNQNFDFVVLGCTHYPSLLNTLKKVLPKGIEFINPAPAIAKQTKKILIENNLSNFKKNIGKIKYFLSQINEFSPYFYKKYEINKKNISFLIDE